MSAFLSLRPNPLPEKERGNGPYRVLVVDDEEPLRNYLFSVFDRYGQSCETASNGEEALKRIAKRDLDAAVIDVCLPGMDGIALTREILKDDPEFPIMVMTGHAEDFPAELAISAGAREFIQKPFSLQEFILRFLKMMRDQEARKTLLDLSLVDELTGLYNRRRFFVLAEQCLKLALRTPKKWILLYMDMDDLKSINDHYGHHEGDQALRDFAKVLKRTFRDSDVIARIGGDEFVVLVEQADENSQTLIHRLDENIENENARRSGRYPLSISVGIAFFDPQHPLPIDELLMQADASMYVNKRRREFAIPL